MSLLRYLFRGPTTRYRSPLPQILATNHRVLTRSMSIFNVSRLQDKVVLVTGASAGIGAVSGRLDQTEYFLIIYSCTQATAVLFAKVLYATHSRLRSAD